jgi:intracellular septation protein A
LIAAIGTFLAVIIMANQMVVHDAPDDIWSKAAHFFPLDAAVIFGLIFLIVILLNKARKHF